MFSAIVVRILALGIVFGSFAEQMTVPFDVCAGSTNWKRPSRDVQARIWRDARYKDLGPRAYQWTHNFFWSEPDSASISYDNQRLSGVWTDIVPNRCPRRDSERGAWTEIWVLNFLVTGITLSNNTYKVEVLSQNQGYEIIQFRLNPLGRAKAMLQFSDQEGKVLDQLVEIAPSVFAPVQ